ncbi:MAG: glycosyltransferase [Eggerthellaceae bacterium]|nr:glycosyltransferase [Eggerthellaceae bacterium]
METPQLPKISVVVPMYNCEAYIGACLESLKNQTLTNFEAICVDDASTDKTLENARVCIGTDERFKIREMQENRGQSAARNVALDVAQGEYVVLLDADDYLVVDALEKLINRAKKQDLDDLYFSARSFYDSKEAQELFWEELDTRAPFDEVADGKELFVAFDSKNEFFPHAALRMVKRSLIEENNIRFYEGIIHEDTLFTFQTMVASKRSSFLSEVLYMRRVRPNSTMASRVRTIATVEGHFICVREMKRWMREHAHTLDDAFIEAMMRQLDIYARTASYDWCDNEDEQAKAAYVASLSKEERIDFFADVVYRGEETRRIKEDILRPPAYYFGDAVMNALRFVKRKIVKSLRPREQGEKR